MATSEARAGYASERVEIEPETSLTITDISDV